MATFAEERERLRRGLHAAVTDGKKTIAEALTVEYDPEQRIRQRLLLWSSNFFLAIAGSEFRARIVKKANIESCP